MTNECLLLPTSFFFFLFNPGEMAAEVFALLVMICDDFFKLTFTGEKSEKTDKIRRFLEIACSLPIDMQMVLSCRMNHNCGDIIPYKLREKAFHKMARFFLQ